MEEKVIIKGKCSKLLADLPKILFLSVCLICLYIYLSGLNDGSFQDGSFQYYTDIFTFQESSFGLSLLLYGCGGLLLVSSFVTWLMFGKCEMTVTNRRVYGKARFGKRVDIPIDSISAVSSGGLSKSIGVSSPSGIIRFVCIENCTEIHSKVNELIVERQKSYERPEAAQPKADQNGEGSSVTAQIKEYKELLDMGALTPEEFEAKKKQLLGL